jgi:thiol-disulfide isomerase/thioredoxin
MSFQKKYKILLFVFLHIVQLAIGQTTKNSVDIVAFNWFEQQRNVYNDTTYVINFWATWCIPCVAELPHFEAITEKYKTQKVKVILVSLDFAKTINKQLMPFLAKKNIKSKVVLLNDPDYNAWIDKVNPTWSGGLPATLIFNNKTSFVQFFEKELTFVELDSVLKNNISK